MGHHLGLATRTQISVCKSPFPSAGTAVSLFESQFECMNTTDLSVLLLQFMYVPGCVTELSNQYSTCQRASV